MQISDGSETRVTGNILHYGGYAVGAIEVVLLFGGLRKKTE